MARKWLSRRTMRRSALFAALVAVMLTQVDRFANAGSAPSAVPAARPANPARVAAAGPVPPVTPAVPVAPAVPAAQAVPMAPVVPAGPEAVRSGAPRRVLHLDEATREAIAHHPVVLSAKAQAEAADARTGQARSGLFPQLTGTAVYERVRGNSGARASTAPTGTSAAVTGVSGNETFNLFSFGLNATQLVWDFGQTADRTRAAARATDAARFNERSTEVAVLLQVRRAFFQARAQKALLQVARETLVNLQRHFIQAEGFVRAGTSPEIDLAQSRTDLANGRVNLVNAENAYEIAKAALNQAIGWSAGTDYDLADDDLGPVPGEDMPLDQLVETALSSRPDVLALERQRQALELTVSAIRGAYGPTLSAVGGLTESGLALDELSTGWSVGGVLSWPLFQGGLTRSQVREARANVAVITGQIEQIRLQVRFDVEQAVLNVRAAKTVIDAAREAVVSARLQLKLAESRYATGVGSIIELGDAQVAATNAEAQVVGAEYNLAAARAQLLSALGRT